MVRRELSLPDFLPQVCPGILESVWILQKFVLSVTVHLSHARTCALLGPQSRMWAPLIFAPWMVSRQAPLSLEFPGKNIGMGCHFLFQGIFLTQGSMNPCLLLDRWILHHWVTRDAWFCDFVILSLSHIQLLATPLTAACQASLSYTVSWSFLKLMSIELMMPSNHLIPCRPLLLSSSIFLSHQGLYQ